MGKQSWNYRFWQKSDPSQKRLFLDLFIRAIPVLVPARGEGWGQDLGRDNPVVVGWLRPPIPCLQDACPSSASPADVENQILPGSHQQEPSLQPGDASLQELRVTASSKSAVLCKGQIWADPWGSEDPPKRLQSVWHICEGAESIWQSSLAFFRVFFLHTAQEILQPLWVCREAGFWHGVCWRLQAVLEPQECSWSLKPAL